MEFIKEQKKPANANYRKKCLYCGREFDCVRIDAQFCTTLCRVKYKKAGKKIDLLEQPKNSEIGGKNGKYREFDFVSYLGGATSDPRWIEFTNYLKQEFGLQKCDSTSYKRVLKWVIEYNRTHKRTIDFQKHRVKGGTRIIFLVN